MKLTLELDDAKTFSIVLDKQPEPLLETMQQMCALLDDWAQSWKEENNGSKNTYKIRHDDETRLKIKAAQIINRIQGHLLGKLDLSQTQVSCAKILLDKVLPNLQATELTGDAASFVMRLPEPAADTATWQATHAVTNALPIKH